MNPPLKTVIFDFGNVILRTQDYSIRTKWDDKLGVAHGTLEDYIFNGPIGSLAQKGQASWENVWPDAAAHFKLSTAEMSEIKETFFKTDTIDSDLVDYIRRLKTHYCLGLLSNTWYVDGQVMLSKFGLADDFDFSVTSAEVGVMKPDAHIYQVALERAKAEPAQAVFVDDAKQNIVGARNLGMHTVHYVDPKAARLQLVQLTGVN